MGAPRRQVKKEVESTTLGISLVIPVYNEKESLPELWARSRPVLESLSLGWELLFIDDGSNDGSFEVLRELRREDSRIRVFRFTENRGQSAALAAGFRHSQGEVVVTMDADLQNDPADIPSLLSRLKRVDMVTGWRRNRRDPWSRRLSSKIAFWYRQRFTGDGIRDTGCTLRAMRRSCLEEIKLYENMHRFLPALFQIEGFRVREVPVRHHPRRYGKSKYSIRNRLWVGIVDCFAVRWMRKRALDYNIEERLE